MSIALMPARPPYVRFEQRTEEDREATIASGGPKMRDVAFVVVMQPGSKDTFEQQADLWLEYIAKCAEQGGYPPEWSEHFHREYANWKAGMQTGELGMAIREWASLTKAQAENLIACNVRTVEDAAAMNEQTMQRYGMGSREIKNKALAYLESREANKGAELITALRAESANKDARIDSLEKRVAELASMVEATSGRKRG